MEVIITIIIATIAICALVTIASLIYTVEKVKELEE